MKAVVAWVFAAGMVTFSTGCMSTSRQIPPVRPFSEYSTAQRLWDGDRDIQRRAESLQRRGLSADEARQYAEIEYLKSRAGSPLR